MAKKNETKKTKKQPIRKKLKGKKTGTIDKWKRKTHLKIIADKNFNNTELGETMATKPETIVGRSIKANLGDLSGQRQKRHIKIHFKITNIEGSIAKAEAKGFNITQGYLSRLLRKKNTKINSTTRLRTKDKKIIKTTIIAVTAIRVPERTAKEIRKTITERITEFVKKNTATDIIQEFLFGSISSKLYKEIRKISPMKRMEIEKSLILKE